MIQKISGDFIKLSQLLKLVGVIETGGQARQSIFNKEVTVNKIVCTERNKKIYNGDVVEAKGKVIEVIVDGN